MARYVGLGDAVSDLRTEIIGLRTKLRAATTVESKELILTSLLNRIGQLVAQYRTQGNTELAARWLTQYRGLQGEAAAAGAAISQGETPSAVLQRLDAIGDRAFAFTNTVITGAENIVTGLGTTARALPVLLPLALVLAAFVIGGGGLGGVLRAGRR